MYIHTVTVAVQGRIGNGCGREKKEKEWSLKKGGVEDLLLAQLFFSPASGWSKRWSAVQTVRCMAHGCPSPL